MAICTLLLGLGGGFVLDDIQTIVRNTLIHVRSGDFETWMYAASSFHAGNGSRPLPMLSFAFDYWRSGGLSAEAFKTTNLVIHGLTVVALALFLRRLLSLAGWTAIHAAAAALSLALLWGIHPLQVSSVLYVVQRMQTLATLFLILALWGYVALRQAQIAGRQGVIFGVISAACWLMALLCKEDAILLPAYTLALELTVVSFRAQLPARRRGLRVTYAVLTASAAALFVFVVLPHYWRWESYPGRDFSSIERVLTQGRVLAMYLGQILLPLPGRLPFHYDHLEISRGLLQPATTLPALILVCALLAWAWHWRQRRPLFAFGILFFFGGHALTSNVLNLELAFEHRNHLPLTGILIALADLMVVGSRRLGLEKKTVIMLVSAIIAATGTATMFRAYSWGDPLRLARSSVDYAPHSSRAWANLAGAYFDLSGRKPDSPWLARAIETTEQGAVATNSATLLSNLVIYRSIQGTAHVADWKRLLSSLEQSPMTAQHQNIARTLIGNAKAGIPLEESGLIEAVTILAERGQYHPREYMHFGLHVYQDTSQPNKALPFFILAAEKSPPHDPELGGLISYLIKTGRPDWANRLRSINNQHD